MNKLTAKLNQSTIENLLSIIVILNSFDCYATLWGVRHQFIVEINPINKMLLDKNPIFFVIFKLFTALLLIISFIIPNKKTYYLRFYGGILLIVSLSFVTILHLRWIRLYIF